MIKKLVIGSIFAAFLMMLLPTTSAVESNFIHEDTRSKYISEILDIDIEELKEKYSNPSSPGFIIVQLLIFLLRLLQVGMIAFWGIVGIIIVIVRNLGNRTGIQ